MYVTRGCCFLCGPLPSSFPPLHPPLRTNKNGAWVNDKMHGDGVYKFASGSVYEGAFRENMFHGKGVYLYADGAKYVGQWENNKMHGQGEYTDAAGVIWSGTFFNGLYDSGKTYVSLRPTTSVL